MNLLVQEQGGGLWKTPTNKAVGQTTFQPTRGNLGDKTDRKSEGVGASPSLRNDAREYPKNQHKDQEKIAQDTTGKPDQTGKNRKRTFQQETPSGESDSIYDTIIKSLNATNKTPRIQEAKRQPVFIEDNENTKEQEEKIENLKNQIQEMKTLTETYQKDIVRINQTNAEKDETNTKEWKYRKKKKYIIITIIPQPRCKRSLRTQRK